MTTCQEKDLKVSLKRFDEFSPLIENNFANLVVKIVVQCGTLT